MRTLQNLSKLAAAATVATGLALTAAPAVAEQNTHPDQPSPLACGAGKVFLDGIRAMDVLEEGESDEVYILNENHVKIWPVTAPYVSMSEGQRVEVDKCVPVGTTLRLWDDDGPFNPDDFMGLATLITEGTYNKYFDNGQSRYRLGVLA